MNNFGFISKKRLAKEIAKIYNNNKNRASGANEFHFECGCHNVCNYLCYKLNIKPMHRNKLSGGTGEMVD